MDRDSLLWRTLYTLLLLCPNIVEVVVQHVDLMRLDENLVVNLIVLQHFMIVMTDIANILCSVRSTTIIWYWYDERPHLSSRVQRRADCRLVGGDG